MSGLPLESRIRGCLLGAAIGAELGIGRLTQPHMFGIEDSRILELIPDQTIDWTGEKGRYYDWRATPFINLGVQTYLSAGGRATPEDFARILKDDESLSAPTFKWDGIHTTQEILREGMNPRISGLGSPPCGHVCASMPAVGIYHFADPEYAYIDGVELASVTQPRLGADWAGLTAAAISAAFDPSVTAASVVDTVLKLAHANNKDLFYDMDTRIRTADKVSRESSDEEFVDWWTRVGGASSIRNEESWFAYNPLVYALVMVARYSQDPLKLMTVLLRAGNDSICFSPVIAGAILGAMGGESVFPSEWRSWGEPIASQWYPIVEVVERRVEKEREILSVVERLSEKRGGDDSLLYDKILGCLLAGSVGNAMGSVVEGWFYRDIDDRYPGGITTILDPSRLESEDDNQMAMMLVETYLEREGLPVMARHFGQTWHERMNRHHYYTICMGNAYDMIRAGWDPRITGHWSVVTGSTVMCMEPVGIYHAADPEYASIDATAISYMYQRGLDVTAAMILSVATAEALKPGSTADSVCRAALDAAPRDKFNTFDKRDFESPHHYIETCLEVARKYDDVFAARPEFYEKCLFYSMFDPLELLALSLAMLVISKGDVRTAAIGGTNIGRDADSIAGRAAMLAGTISGAQSVPADWISLFSPRSIEKIRTNAGRLANLVSDQKLPNLTRRQETARAAK